MKCFKSSINIQPPLFNREARCRMKKLLLIDDESNYCEVLKEGLEFTGKFEVDVSNTGDAGVNKAKETHPDLILLDLMMPDKSGFEVALDLKKAKETSSIPLIFLSGILKENVLDEHKNLIGEGYYVSKTEELEELVSIIDDVIEKAAGRPAPVGKEKVRIVTYLPREHVDFLDKLGKDALFANGFKLSRSETLKQLVEMLRKLNVKVADLDLANNDLSTALLKILEK